MEQHSSQEADSQEEVGTERIQAFSDGVFAVAITLLILDIHVPALEETRGDALALLSGMAHLWPHYLSFFLSFLFVGTIWSNHHTMFSYIKRSNQVLIPLNLLLLLCMVVVAFTAGLLGLYINQPAQWVAVLIYNGVCCSCAASATTRSGGMPPKAPACSRRPFTQRGYGKPRGAMSGVRFCTCWPSSSRFPSFGTAPLGWSSAFCSQSSTCSRSLQIVSK
jgi:uncharacterized membrane protein